MSYSVHGDLSHLETFWTHLITLSHLMEEKLSPMYRSLTGFVKVGCWVVGWQDLTGASAEGRATVQAQLVLGKQKIWGKADTIGILVTEKLQAAPYSFMRQEGIQPQNKMSVEELGSLFFSAFFLGFAVHVKLPVHYACMLFVFSFRNPSTQQRG